MIVDLAVIGGGLLGAATAWSAARAGATVTMLERRTIGAGASGHSAGNLHLIHERMAGSPALSLRRPAIELWRRLPHLLGEDLGVELDQGTLILAETEAERESLRRVAAAGAEHGIPARLLGPAELASQVPGLAPTLAGGLFCPVGGRAERTAAAPALARAAVREGATIQQNTPARSIRVAAGAYAIEWPGGEIRAHAVVIAAGPWTQPVAHSLGVELSLRVRWLMASACRLPPGPPRPSLRRAAGMFTLNQDAAGTGVLGGGWTGHARFPRRGRIDAEALTANRALALRLVPSLAAAADWRSWGAYEASSADGTPIEHEVPGWPRVFVATGCSEGFLHGPLLGERMAHRVATGAHAALT